MLDSSERSYSNSNGRLNHKELAEKTKLWMEKWLSAKV